MFQNKETTTIEMPLNWNKKYFVAIIGTETGSGNVYGVKHITITGL